jgi:ferrous iron transport protein A
MIRDQDFVRLSDLHTGETGTIIQISHGMRYCRRLVSLGFTPGVHVAMVRNYGHGPLIVSVRGSQVALGRGEAARIGVKR